MDQNTARQVLRIFPDAPLTVELVERAHAGESWARQPSRYEDESQRARATEWAQTLAGAREVLLQEARVTPEQPSARRRRLPPWAIVGIVVASVAVVGVIVAASLGAVRVATEFVTAAEQAIESGLPGDAEYEDVERFEASETFFTFPAALELYNDNRLGDQCPSDYLEGCWQGALFLEESCDTLQVELGFSDSPTAPTPTDVASVEKQDARAGEAVDLVFGNDDYDYGWINDVTCAESSPEPALNRS